MSTQHDRLIQAGAPALKDNLQYQISIVPRNGQYVVTVDVRDLDSTALFASIQRNYPCPAVSDIVDIAIEAAGKADPEGALSAAVRELAFG